MRCYLSTDVERPELRAGFKYPDLTAHVLAHRAELVVAALTIVRAHVAAGEPASDALPLGSFGQWCRRVREPLLWLGLSDPVDSQRELAASSDTKAAAERQFVALLARLAPGSITAREVCDLARPTLFDGSREDQQALRDVIEELAERSVEAKATPRRLGLAMGSIAGKVFGGSRLARVPGRGNSGVRYRVEPASSATDL